MPLSAEEKAARARERMIETAKKYRTSTYARNVVAKDFQKMIRAEWASIKWPYAFAMCHGELRRIHREVGQNVCVTCGRLDRWGSGQMQAGHFLASRRNSILFEEDNIAPQCCHCNNHLSGNQQAYRAWMIEMKGEATVERLERLKTQSVTFGREELVDMRIEYMERLKAAIERMQRG